MTLILLDYPELHQSVIGVTKIVAPSFRNLPSSLSKPVVLDHLCQADVLKQFPYKYEKV